MKSKRRWERCWGMVALLEGKRDEAQVPTTPGKSWLKCLISKWRAIGAAKVVHSVNHQYPYNKFWHGCPLVISVLEMEKKESLGLAGEPVLHSQSPTGPSERPWLDNESRQNLRNITKGGPVPCTLMCKHVHTYTSMNTHTHTYPFLRHTRSNFHLLFGYHFF